MVDIRGRILGSGHRRSVLHVVAGIVLLWAASVCPAQAVKLPKEVATEIGTIAVVKADTDCSSLRWIVLDPGLSMIPPELLKDSKSAVVMSGRVGRYRLLAYGALKDVASDPAICTVVVGNAPPTPDPPPNPSKVTVPNVVGQRYEDAQATLKALGLMVASGGNLGQPVASQSPVAGVVVAAGSTVTLTCGEPPSPAPIPVAGFRVLIVEETAERGKLTAGQRAAILGKETRDYLNAKCVKEGMQAAYWILDKDVDMSATAAHWQAAFKRPRASHPWLIVSNGTTGFEGPLPEKIEDTLAILKKHAEGPQSRTGEWRVPVAGAYTFNSSTAYFGR